MTQHQGTGHVRDDGTLLVGRQTGGGKDSGQGPVELYMEVLAVSVPS